MKLKLILGCLLAAPAVSHAAILALYTFEGNSYASSDIETSSTATSYTDQATGLSSSFLGSVTGTGLINFVTEDTDGSGPGTDSTIALGIAMQRDYESGVSLGSAPSGRTAASTWHEFTISPSSGNVISLSTITLDVSYFSGLANSNTGAQFVISADTGSGFSTLGTIAGPAALTTTGDSAFETISLDISSLVLAADQAVTFRLDPQATGNSNGNISQRRFTMDNITVNGDVTPVPEPSTALLGGFGLLALLRRRR